MPSTYSTSLRLELIGNGEQAANWGNTTNTNLGTLIEQAIAGVQSIAMTDANYTLVSGNGVSDEARNAVVIMTGTLTATRNVVVPTADKFYAVRNATTGGRSILVKTSAGTGVTLANGFTQLMYCDGTNVVLASVPINSSNGNVAVGGTLAVTGTSTLTGNTTVGGDLAVTGNISVGGSGLFPPATIVEYGGTSAPSGWLLCDGAAVSRTTYAGLFAVLGTAYGAGDGSTTFNVPDRRGRFGVGADGTYTRGSTGGSTTTSSAGSHNHTGSTGSTAITEAQMPSHAHNGLTQVAGDHQHGTAGQSGQGGGINSVGNYGSSNNYILASGGTNQFLTSNAGNHQHYFTTDPAGGSAGHTHTISTDGTHTHTATPPYVASNYIIKT